MHVLAYLVLCIVFNNLFCNEASQEQTALQNPLLCAATINDVKAMQKLLDEGEDINQSDAQGHTPLHWATFGKSYEAAVLLLERGIKINSLCCTKLSPLFCASCKELKNFMQLYLIYGADFNQPERDDISLLEHLTDHKAADQLQELVNYGHWHQAEPFLYSQKNDTQTIIPSLKLLTIHVLKTKDKHDTLLKTIDIKEHYSLLSTLIEYYTYYVSFNEKLNFFKQLTTCVSEQEIKQLATLLGMYHAQRYEKKWQEVKSKTSLPLAIDQTIIASNMAQSFYILLTPRPAIKDSSPTS